MRTSRHGGGCCGVRHLHGFDGSDERVLRTVKGQLNRRKHGTNVYVGDADLGFNELTDQNQVKHGKIIEVILTDPQIERLPRTCAYLKGYGFKLVHRFKNSTGGFCNVLHYCYSTLPNEESPFELIEAEDLTERKTSKPRVPKVGEVWRVNSTDFHHYPKNCYVAIREYFPDEDWYEVQALNPVYGGTQVVRPSQISFIRDSV